MKETNKAKYKKGQALMISLLLFLGASTSVLFALADPIIHRIQVNRASYDSKESYYVAESLAEDIFYRLNNAMDVGATESLAIGSATADASVADTTDGKQISVTGDENGFNRSLSVNVSTDVGASFNYGLQTGNGGITMSNNATITGNAYSNGNISGSNSATITGTAIAATTINSTPDVTSGTSTTPTYSINLGSSTGGVTQIAQSFTIATTTPVTKFSFYIKKTGAPGNLTVSIVTNSSGSPSTTQVGSSGTLSSAAVTGSYGWIDVYPTSGITLTPGTTYWVRLVIGATSATNYYTLGTDQNAYSGGLAKTKAGNASWATPTPSNQDLYTKIYTGVSSTISGMIVGGDAKALTVSNSSVTGTIYCQNGSGNNKSCNTSQGPSPSLAFPLSDANIDEFIDIASSGSSRGTLNLTNNQATTTTGALKINGDLNMSNGSVLTLGGPLYVTGNINLSNNNTKIKLASSYGSGSGFVIFGGNVSISNEATFAGSGTSGSYIMVAGKTGNISIANNGGSVVLVTLNGTITFSNNATAKAAVARQMVMSNNTTLNYETGLANLNFTTGPSGAWVVDSWKEVE